MLNLYFQSLLKKFKNVFIKKQKKQWYEEDDYDLLEVEDEDDDINTY